MKNKNLFISVLIVLLIIVIVSSVTYAAYVWRSTTGLDVSVDVNDNITVTFNGGTNITGKLFPVDRPTSGIIKEMVIKSNLPSSDPYSVYLKINQLPQVMKDSSFKWVLTDGLNDVNSCWEDIGLPDGATPSCELVSGSIFVGGNFSTSSMSEFTDSVTNDLILLENQSLPYISDLHLYLYIWIDGTVDNSLNLTGNHVDFDVYVKGKSDTFVEVTPQQEGE